MPALKWRVFSVASFGFAIGLVRRGDHDVLDDRAAPAGLEHGPRPANVCLESADRVSVCNPDCGLCGQVKDGVDLVLTKNPFDELLVTYVAAHPVHFVDEARPHEVALRHPITHEANHIGPQLV